VRTLADAGARVGRFDVDGDVARTATAVATHGPLDVAVNVIGGARGGHVVDLDDDAWDESLDLVLRPFFNPARVAGKAMAERGSGALVAIASVSGRGSAPRTARTARRRRG
jgi:NADP-dependent 3-hydroxy acid dehydrogenase YdfG